MTYEYDSLNRVTKVINEDGSYTDFYYDKNGNVIKTENHEKEKTDVPVITPIPSNGPEVSSSDNPNATEAVTFRPTETDPSLGTLVETKEDFIVLEKQTKAGSFEIYCHADGTGYGIYQKPKSKNVKSVTVPAAISYEGNSYPVTEVASGAFAGNKNLKKVIVGKNVERIGENAFKGCKNLKKIHIKSKNLKEVGANACKGIHKDAVIKVPKSKLKDYKNLFKKKGQKKTVKIKK